MATIADHVRACCSVRVLSLLAVAQRQDISADGELSYPQSHLHGGGPPTLEPLSKDEATMRYGANFAG
jgi:hypothetical protein